jgi:hypothetical protein
VSQSELFELEPVPSEGPASVVWGAHRLVEPEPSSAELVVSWGAYVITRERGEQQLARWLARDSVYRAYRCVLCRRAAVVSLAEWRSERAQVVKCAYRGCSGWVQRDCDPVIPEWSAEEPDEPA